MSEPTAQELRLAALLHDADLACEGNPPLPDCGYRHGHLRQARALIARGVRLVEPLSDGTHETNSITVTTAVLDWRDQR